MGARGKTAAVDHAMACCREGCGIGHGCAEAQIGTQATRFRGQPGKRGTRHDMRFLGIEQSAREAAGEMTFKPVHALGVGPLVAFGQARKAGQLALVAWRRDHQAAARDHARIGRLPKLQAPQTEGLDDRLGRLGLAVGRQHGAGDAAGQTRDRLRQCLVQNDRMAAACEREGLPQAEDAAADNNDGELFQGRTFGRAIRLTA